MSFEKDAVHTLTQLGLTPLESRIYVILCKHAKLSTKQISKLTNTAQSDVYRVMKTLEQKGLVEKKIEKPVSYKSVPFETGSTFLIERKKAEFAALEQKTKRLNKHFKERKKDELSTAHESRFLMIPKRENVVKKIREAIDRSERKVDLLLSWKRLYKGMTDTFIESSEKAWSRGVRFRIVAEIPEDPVALTKAEEFRRISPMCTIRFLPSHPKTVMGIYDKREAFVVVDPREALFDSPALWSNNQSLITAIQEHFDLLWLVSMKKPNQALK